MHAPAHFRMNETAEMEALIRARPFATLVVAGANGPQAAHLPMLIEDGVLMGHLARHNALLPLIGEGSRALAIFHGPDAYVTPSLYISKREHGKVVPTWNYIAVEVSGRIETFSEPALLRAHLEAMTDQMEHDAAVPWAVGDAPDEYIAKMLNGITGVRMTIDSLEGVRKLSQNRNDGDRAGVINGFTHSPDPQAQQLAREMKEQG